MNGQVQFVTNEKGEQTGVLLDIDMYYELISAKTDDPEFLTGLSRNELEALAEIKLAINQQIRLDKLIEKQKESTLVKNEEEELDRLLDYIDQLTILKARAMYTLQKMLGVPL